MVGQVGGLWKNIRNNMKYTNKTCKNVDGETHQLEGKVAYPIIYEGFNKKNPGGENSHQQTPWDPFSYGRRQNTSSSKGANGKGRKQRCT